MNKNSSSSFFLGDTLEIALNNGITLLQLELSKAAQNKLLAYMELLQKWNRAYNLIATTDPYEILTHHIFDSLSIAPYVTGQRVLDVGTGAGLPGIPLSIALPDQDFVLLDSIGKKTRFLLQAVNELKLTNVTIVQTRVEEFFPDECFDNVMARAVSSIKALLNSTRHVLCSDGKWLLMKGLYPEEELKDLQANTSKVIPLQVPGLEKQRHLVCIEATP